ncbi:hypothetical protein HYN59_15180 [Flavobacterium album]|uniref:Uncharacterized protein n=1 Tax=Flavobacterium album TaxID=2175091 RepID=A0A2S1R165_9FLAO|nr:hypothetical protein [Flavobacterium album]AWH86367.1 hypothetical protein HYN59_15180 [Flavobacterium album]
MFTNDSHNVPIPGPWGWASEMLTNYVFKPELEKVIQDLRNEAISKFQITKQYGLEASILFLQSPAGDIGKYRSHRVSTPILKKLLKGDFLTMKDVISSDHYPDQINTIIYQVFDEGFSGEEYAVIDCIFVGDNLLK